MKRYHGLWRATESSVLPYFVLNGTSRTLGPAHLISASSCRGFGTAPKHSTSGAKSGGTNLSEQCRNIMRQLPRPVVIVTTLDFPESGTRGGNTSSEDFQARAPSHWSETERSNPAFHGRPIPRAMTVSSFTSLSLKPTPIVMFSVTLPSRTHSAILKNGWFNVHVLSGDEHGAKVADVFTHGSAATRGDSRGLGIMTGLEEHGIQVIGRGPRDDSWDPDCRAPLLRGLGIMSALRCRVHKSRHIAIISGEEAIDSGETTLDDQPSLADQENYTLIIAKVMEVVDDTNNDVPSEIALGYVDGAYRRPGDSIMRHSTDTTSTYYRASSK